MGGLAWQNWQKHLRISFLLYGRTGAPMRCSRMLPICAMGTLVDELFWRKKRKNRCVDALFRGCSFARSCPTDEGSCCGLSHHDYRVDTALQTDECQEWMS